MATYLQYSRLNDYVQARESLRDLFGGLLTFEAKIQGSIITSKRGVFGITHKVIHLVYFTSIGADAHYNDNVMI